jgi:hypothetical protein
MNQPTETRPVLVAPAQWVTITLASACTGYSEKAIRRKIEDGVWLEHTHWKRAPDGRILISMKGYHEWAVAAAA